MTHKTKRRKFQLTAARRRLGHKIITIRSDKFVSTHSRPKAAGFLILPMFPASFRFNSQPPEGGWRGRKPRRRNADRFQLTAARRRLGGARLVAATSFRSFNSQPPEGGWDDRRQDQATEYRFNSQPPEGGWDTLPNWKASKTRFNSQPPEGGWLANGFNPF